MQHHPGSWYLPWAVPLQKMLAVPFQHPGAGAAPPLNPYAPNGNGVTCQVLPTNQHQHSPNSAAATAAAVAMQAQTAAAAAAAATHNYQHQAAVLHNAAGGQVPMGANPYTCAPNTTASYNHSGNSAAAAAAAAHSAALNSQLQNHAHAHAQALHPAAAAAAAAAMFTPLSMRSFLTTAGLAAQQTLTPCVPSVHQQSPAATAAAVNAAAAAAAAQQITCLPTSPSPQHHAQHQHQHQHTHQHQHQQLSAAMNLNVGVVTMRHHPTANGVSAANSLPMPIKKLISSTITDKDKLSKLQNPEKRKADDSDQIKDLKKAKLETKALKAKRPGFTDERYHETSYYIENGLRKVYPYYFTFTTFTKGRWVGEKILDVFAREFRAHPAEEYERCIKAGTLTVNYDKVPIDYRLKHNDLLANIVHRHEVPVTSQPITIVHMDDDIVVVNKPASIPVHPCGRYRHNTVVFILAKEYNLKNLRTIHRLDRLTSGLLLFGRSPKKARQMEHQIRNRQVQKEYICRVEGDFPEGIIECKEPIEVISYKIGVCKVSTKGKDCTTTFQKIANNGKTSVVLCKPLTGRMHQIRVHLQYLGYPVVNDPLYNHDVFGPLKGRGGDIGGKTDEQLVRDLINIHNAENWLGIDGDAEMSLFKTIKSDCDTDILSTNSGPKGHLLSDDDSETVSREASESPQPTLIGSESPNESCATQTTTGNATPVLHASVSVGTETAPIAINGKTFNIAGGNPNVKVTVATQTGHESPDMAFSPEKMTADKHCYECKVRYRDPKPKDLVMYLHAWKYKGPGWEYETELPSWASTSWVEPESD